MQRTNSEVNVNKHNVECLYARQSSRCHLNLVNQGKMSKSDTPPTENVQILGRNGNSIGLSQLRKMTGGIGGVRSLRPKQEGETSSIRFGWKRASLHLYQGDMSLLTLLKEARQKEALPPIFSYHPEIPSKNGAKVLFGLSVIGSFI
ncbi:hypothetical protein J6590_057072 [Homalodisca vitripennis]|nr:hypothetical protein J6590_057072 [Homalodisca vitripennis]